MGTKILASAYLHPPPDDNYEAVSSSSSFYSPSLVVSSSFLVITSIAITTGGVDDENDDNYGVSKVASSSLSIYSSLVTTSLLGGIGGEDYNYDNEGFS